MITYLIEAHLILLVLAGLYRLLLVKESSFVFNRFFLLGSCLLVMAIPLLHIPISIEAELPMLPTLETEESTLSEAPALFFETMTGFVSAPEQAEIAIPWERIALSLYLATTACFLIRTLICLRSLSRFIKRHRIKYMQDFYMVKSKEIQGASSFFNYLFWEADRSLTTKESQMIIAHERVHIQQWHSLDLLISELVKALLWCNPIAWWLRKQIEATHEFLADNHASKAANPDSYIELLLRQTAHGLRLSLSHSFNFSLLKNRIAMLKTNPSKLPFWKVFVSLSVVVLTVGLMACEEDEQMTYPIDSKLDIGILKDYSFVIPYQPIEVGSKLDLKKINRFELVLVEENISLEFQLDSNEPSHERSIKTENNRVLVDFGVGQKLTINYSNNDLGKQVAQDLGELAIDIVKYSNGNLIISYFKQYLSAKSNSSDTKNKPGSYLYVDESAHPQGVTLQEMALDLKSRINNISKDCKGINLSMQIDKSGNRKRLAFHFYPTSLPLQEKNRIEDEIYSTIQGYSWIPAKIDDAPVIQDLVVLIWNQ